MEEPEYRSSKEASLAEYVDTFPKCHRIQREYLAIGQHIKDLKIVVFLLAVAFVGMTIVALLR